MKLAGEKAIDRGINSVVQISLQFSPRAGKPGAAMEVPNAEPIPRLLPGRFPALPRIGNCRDHRIHRPSAVPLPASLNGLKRKLFSFVNSPISFV